jgi:DNA-binding MarR family transcriptional regulator
MANDIIDQDIERRKMIETLSEATRQMSTWTVMFHSAVASQVDLNITDHKCLDILNDQGPMTAGQLAEITGLTTGAVTGVIDRLEYVGFVRRERDPRDRRRVIVQPNDEKAAEVLGPIFKHFQQRYAPALENYSDDELRVLLRFIEQSIHLMQQEIEWLRKK